MTTTIATTKNELKEAVENKAEHIVLSGPLSDFFMKLEKIQQLSQTKLKALIAFASGAGAAVIAGIAAAPETVGISLAFSATAVTVFAATEGMNIYTVAEYLTFCALLGIKTVKILLVRYDIQFKKDKDGKKQLLEFKINE